MAFRRSTFLLLMALVLCAAVSNAAVVQLPQTGLTTCVDGAGAPIACAGTGQDGELRAGAPWPSPRFTVNGDGTITDQLTGLMWTADAGTPTVGSCTGGALTWSASLSYVACINGSNYLGHGDWRLPNINELESLMNLGNPQSATWLGQQGFANVGLQQYWSSTTVSSSTSSAWVVDTGSNVVTYSAKTVSARVWAVRQ